MVDFSANLNPNSQRNHLKEIKFFIEDLLNSKPSFNHKYDICLNFGLPDLSLYNLYTEKDQNIVAALIKSIIKRFEKRLINIDVIPYTKKNKYDDTEVQFFIKGLINKTQEYIKLNLFINFKAQRFCINYN